MRVNRLGQPIGEELATWVPPVAPAREALEGRYCRLEPLELDAHARDLWDAYAHDVDHRHWTYLQNGPFATIEAYAEWVSRASAGRDPLFFAVLSGEPLRASGVAAFLRISPDAGSIEVGHINFSPLLQRTRAATESMYLMMRRAFSLGYRRYEWKCDALNAPSRAAAVRLGLTFEGVFRQATVYKGRNRDSAWYSAIDKEWPALERAFEAWLAADNFDQAGRQRQQLSTLRSPAPPR
ncbi:MAG: GNAT family N-acetyltransferase [Acidobacteriota bacterium]